MLGSPAALRRVPAVRAEGRCSGAVARRTAADATATLLWGNLAGPVLRLTVSPGGPRAAPVVEQLRPGTTHPPAVVNIPAQ